MKKTAAALIPLLALLTACSPGMVPTATPSPSAQQSLSHAQRSAADYFAFTADTYMEYGGAGNEYAAYAQYVDYRKDRLAQVRQITGGTTTVRVYQLSDDRISEVFSRGETYYRYDYTGERGRENVLLKNPIAEGNSWTLEGGDTRSITAVDTEVKTGAGNYKAVEVTTRGKAYTQKDYYAEGVGLIKSVYQPFGEETAIETTLERIAPETSLQTDIRLFFAHPDKDRTVYEDRSVSVDTNQEMAFVIDAEIKSPPPASGLIPPLYSFVRVLGVKLDADDGIVTVDLTPSFIAGPEEEARIEDLRLQAVANTFGRYYQVPKAIMTIEGAPYKSTRRSFAAGEYITVDEENAVEYTH